MKLIGTLTPNKDIEVFGIAEIFVDDTDPVFKYKAFLNDREVQKSRTLTNLVKRVKTYNFYDIIKKATVHGFIGTPKTVGAIFREV